MNNLLNEPAAGFEATKRTARILEIVQLVAGNPRRYRRADLAQRFEISERMIQKDGEVWVMGGWMTIFSPMQNLMI